MGKCNEKIGATEFLFQVMIESTTHCKTGIRVTAQTST